MPTAYVPKRRDLVVLLSNLRTYHVKHIDGAAIEVTNGTETVLTTAKGVVRLDLDDFITRLAAGSVRRHRS